jgi:hypothetical protein
MSTVIIGRVTWTDGNQPVNDVSITDIRGQVHHLHIHTGAPLGHRLHDASVGLDIHAFRLTRAGHVAEIDLYLTSTHRILTQYFPRGSEVFTLCFPAGEATCVNVLSAQGGRIYNLSAPVAARLGLRRLNAGVRINQPVASAGRFLVDTLCTELWGIEHGLKHVEVR